MLCLVYPRVYTTPEVTLGVKSRITLGYNLGITLRMNAEVLFTLGYTEQPAPGAETKSDVRGSKEVRSLLEIKICMEKNFGFFFKIKNI